MRRHAALAGAVRSVVGVVVAVTFAVMSGVIVMLLGLVLAPH